LARCGVGGGRVLVLLLTLVFACGANADDVLELRVKSAFLFNFAKFTTWPAAKLAGTSDPIRLCVLEPDPFGEILDSTVSGKSINGHPLVLRRASRAAELRNCDLVYVGTADPAMLGPALRELAGNSILVVYEGAAAMPNGAIRFTLVDQKVRFEVNLATVERESLQLNVQLLALSTIVRQEPK
jgi:hypothetical protein